MTVETQSHFDKTTTDYRPTYEAHQHFINDQHANIGDLVESVPGKMWPEDAWKLYEMAYYAQGPVVEIGGLDGKSTVILALALQAAGRGVSLVSLDRDPTRCERAAAYAKPFAPHVPHDVRAGTSTEVLPQLSVHPAFAFVDGEHDYESVRADLRQLDEWLLPDGFVLLHDYYDRRNDDPDEPHYGVNRAALDTLDPHRYAFCGRFGCSALFQKQAVPPQAKTYEVRTSGVMGSVTTGPQDEQTLDALITALVNYFDLPKYGIDWNDGERVIPEIWALHPKRRFTYFAHLAVYDFACRFADGKRVLDVGGGVGYGDYYLIARGAREVVSLDVDEKAHRFACDRYQHENLRFFLGPVEALALENPEPFDFIFCSNVMEHVADYDSALTTICNLLAPDGVYLQVTPPSGKARGNPYHVTNFTVPQWREILSPLFASQHYFAHIPLRERADTKNQFDFRFQECGPNDMNTLGSIGGMILCEKPVVSVPAGGRLGQGASPSVFEKRTDLPFGGRIGNPTSPARDGGPTPYDDHPSGVSPALSVPVLSKGESRAEKLSAVETPQTDVLSAEPEGRSIRQRQMENEHFVPLLGLDLEPYLETENKNGIHHVGRYLWAVEVLRQRRSQSILDIACGAGFGSYLLARDLAGTTVVGADDDTAAVDNAQQTYHHENLHYVPGDVARWELGEFDAIICFDTIEHVRHREIMLQNFVEHLSPDGCLLLSTPVRSKLVLNPDWEHHAIEYTAEALVDFLRRYFQRVCRPEDGTLPCAEFFDRINDDRQRYQLMANPLVCEGPIRL